MQKCQRFCHGDKNKGEELDPLSVIFYMLLESFVKEQPETVGSKKADPQSSSHHPALPPMFGRETTQKFEFVS